MPPKFKFCEGERVMCFHGPLLYEAKCVKQEQKDKLIRYFVHYQGWNKSWDEWVPEDRVLKYNEANVKRARDLQTAQSTAKGKGKKDKMKPGRTPGSGDRDRDAPSPAPSDSSQKGGAKTKSDALVAQIGGKESKESKEGPPKKKAKLDPYVETEEEFTARIEVKIVIPDEIRTWLVDDWDFVTRQKKLFELPAKLTVNKVLEDYLAYKKTSKKDPGYKETHLTEVVDGIKEYFNTTLGTLLLYKFERPQYQKLIKESDGMDYSALYGAIYLCRLFVKLGQMLAYTTLDETDMTILKSIIDDLLKFVVKQNYFAAADYFQSSSEYQRKAL